MVDKEAAGHPGFYSLNGTYKSGNPGEILANETVCVVLEQRPASDYNFHLDYLGAASSGNSVNKTKWFNFNPMTLSIDSFEEFTNTDSVNLTANATNKSTFDCTITLILRNNGQSTHYEMRSLSLNGASLNVPYLPDPATLIDLKGNYTKGDQAANQVKATTTLPMGSEVTITVEPYLIGTTEVDGLNGGTVANVRQRKYTIEVKNAARDIVFDHGTFVSATNNNYREVNIAKLYGVDCEWYRKAQGSDSNADSGYAWCEASQATSARAAGDNNTYGFNYSTVSDSSGEQYSTSDEPTTPHGNVRFKLSPGYNWTGGKVYGTADNPTVSYVEEHATGPTAANTFSAEKGNIQGPDSAGWYYITLSDPYTGTSGQSTVSHIGYLSIEAQAMQYQISYLDGADATALNPNFPSGVDVSGMPTFRVLDENGAETAATSHTDTNRGKSYSMGSAAGSYSGSIASDQVAVAGQSPSAPDERPISFEGWVVTDGQGKPIPGVKKGTVENPLQPNDLVSLSDIFAYASCDDLDTQNYTIYLTAKWNTSVAKFSYYVTFNEKDTAGTATTRFGVPGSEPMPAELGTGDYVLKREVYTNAESVNVVFESTALAEPIAGTSTSPVDRYLAANPWYQFDMSGTKNGSTGHEGEFYWENVTNNGEIPIWFESNLGRVTVKKTVEGHAAPGEMFKFNVEFTLPSENASGTLGDETKFFGDGSNYKVTCLVTSKDVLEPEERTFALTLDDGVYKGVIELADGETATIDLPNGTKYSIDEQESSNYDVTQPSGGAPPNATVAKMTVSGPYEFTNALKNVDVRIEQRIHNGEHPGDNPESQPDFSTDPLLAMAGNFVDYQITVTNRSKDNAYSVSLVNQVPEAVGDTSGDHKKMLLIPATIIDGDGITHELTEASEVQGQSQLKSGGKITWTINKIEPGKSKELGYTTVAPNVEHVHDYPNSATATASPTSGEGTALPAVKSNEVAVTDTISSLYLEKVVEPRNSSKDQTFEFEIQLTGDAVSNISQLNYRGGVAAGYNPADVDSVNLDTTRNSTISIGSTGKGTFSLKEGQAVTFVGIPKDTNYTVLEKVKTGDYSVAVSDPAGASVGTQRTDGDATTVSVTKTMNGSDAHSFTFTNTSLKDPGLTLVKSHATGTAAADQSEHTVVGGDEITYTITATNTYAKTTATNVQITDVVPEDLSLVEGSVTDGGTSDTASRTITWTIDSLGPVASKSVSFKAKVPYELHEAKTWTNTATATCTTPAGIPKVTSNEVDDHLTPTGAVHVVNKVNGSGANQNDVFCYHLTVVEPRTPAAMLLTSAGLDSLDGSRDTSFALTLIGNVEVVVENVRGGAHYSVKADAGNPEGYRTTDSGNTEGVVPPWAKALVTFVNTKDATPVTPSGPGTITPPGPSVPDGPLAPDDPDNPDDPDDPDDPDNPDTPPDGPIAPDDPDNPDDPSTPDTPDTPSGPDTPSEPDQPGVPSTPSTPGSVSPSSPSTASTEQKEPTSAIPKTGDDQPLVLPVALAACGFVLLATALHLVRTRVR